jgi:hypothetical protein
MSAQKAVAMVFFPMLVVTRLMCVGVQLGA